MTTHVSFTLFVDYLMASGPSRISMIQDHLSPRDGEFDCYAPFKAAMADIMRTGMQRGILPFWVKEHGGRARDNLLDLAAGFLQREGQIQGWSEPTILPLPIGSDCSVDVNPEIGGMVGGVPTWIKLYLRKEPLLYDRMLVMMSVLKRALDLAHGRGRRIEAQQVAVFDVRQGAICTPTMSPVFAARVDTFTNLVTAEGVGYGVLRSLAEKAREENERRDAAELAAIRESERGAGEVGSADPDDDDGDLDPDGQ
jgi:hypothetical protein